MTTTALAAAAMAGVNIAGLVALKRAWRVKDAARPWLIVTGWLVLFVPAFAAAPILGEARGPFIAMTVVCATASIFVMAGVQVRESRSRTARETALDPSDRQSRAWRGWLRWMLAGPVGLFAAMGIAIAYAVLGPGAPQTRLVIGGMMVPFLWGGAMAWTLSDDRILRATAVLVATTVVTFSVAGLMGF